MKLNILIYSILWLAPLFANAQQGFITILDSIAVNNKTLASAKQFAEAAKTGARTGIYLDNPMVSYDWLNSPSSSFSEMLITQSFDFPTAYHHKGNIATLSAQQADENYRLAKLDVFNEAANVYTEIVSVNRKISMLTERESMIDELHIGSEKKLLAGESTIFGTWRRRYGTVAMRFLVNSINKAGKVRAWLIQIPTQKFRSRPGELSQIPTSILFSMLIGTQRHHSLTRLMEICKFRMTSIPERACTPGCHDKSQLFSGLMAMPHFSNICLRIPRTPCIAITVIMF